MIKQVVNDDGGKAVASDFTLSVDATNPTPASFKGADAPGVEVSLAPGAYAVTETGGPTGYTGTFSADCVGSIALGQVKTCTVTNDDRPAKLIVKKIVINDDGGTKTAADFSFKVNGGSATAFEADGQNDLTVNAGNYSVTEPAAAGYTTTYDNCNELTLANGGTATCTITNNDQPAKLIVKKIVINDNGGTKTAADFSFKVNGGSATAFEADGQNDLTVNAGNYSVTEPAAAGYTTTYDNCNELTLANGATATCTITNNDQPAKLIVKKIVINDNGGTKTAADFSFEVNGGSATAFEADGQNDLTVNAGNYSVTEPAASRLHHQLRQLRRARARQRRHRHLHDHQQRPAREADRQEDRHQRQRRHQDRRRLHARRQRRQRDPRVVCRQRRRRPGLPAPGRLLRQRDRRGRWIHGEPLRGLCRHDRTGRDEDLRRHE